MNYTQIYNNHHLTAGLYGSGSGVLSEKLAIIDRAGLSGSCLDYGCGWGQLAGSFDDYAGVDISEVAIGYAKEINPTKPFHVVVNGTLDLGRTFDFALCLSVLTHCEDDDVERIFADLSKHTNVAVVDIIHGNGGDWSLRKRGPSCFGDLKYCEIGKIVSRYGIEHTYYKVSMG